MGFPNFSGVDFAGAVRTATRWIFAIGIVVGLVAFLILEWLLKHVVFVR